MISILTTGLAHARKDAKVDGEGVWQSPELMPALSLTDIDLSTWHNGTRPAWSICDAAAARSRGCDLQAKTAHVVLRYIDYR